MLTGPDAPIRTVERELPSTPRDGLLLRVELGGVCATDLHIAQGHLPGFDYPATLGHEVCGVVEEVGPEFGTDVRGRPVAVGQRVAVMPATPCGRCPACRSAGRYPECANWDVIGFSNPEKRPAGGGWGQFALLNGRARVFVTDAPAAAAVLAEPAATPVEGLLRAGLKLGDTVLVQGTGTVGLLAVAVAAAAGASAITAIGGPPRRLALAAGLGATTTIDISAVPTVGERREIALAGNRLRDGYDVVVECAGVPATLPEGLSLLRRGGVYVELGHFSDAGEVAINPYRHILSRDVRLVSSSGYTPDSFGRALDVVERLGPAASALITHRLPMSRASDALHALTPAAGWMLDGVEVGKLVIDPWA